MNGSTIGKIGAGILGVAVVGVGIAALSGVFNKGFTDGGIDVRNTACQEIGAARGAVNAELETRKAAAQAALDAAKETASDNFWDENRRLEDAYHQCISGALTADPCKKAFDEVGRLYEEIMADFDAGKGFNEAKFNEREQAKKEYNDCVEKARNGDFYKSDTAECDANLAAGKSANEQARQAAEAAAQQTYADAIATAEAAAREKQAILDAIEAKCNEPGGNTNVNAGALTTGGTGTEISTGSACTGIFDGNDPALRKTLSDLESQLQKARAAGLTDGPYGTTHLRQAVDDARQALKDSQRSCTKDADCGDPTPVCCSNNEVGRVYCDDGVCVNERTECDEGEICAGKPAQCVSAAEGAQQQEGVNISQTIPEVGACSQNLQVLNMQKATPESDRFTFTGNIPNWLHITPPGGKLPNSNVNITYDCNTVQGFGPGTYTVNASVQIYDAAGNLINTFPFNVAITVEPSAAEMVEVIQYGNKYIPISQLRRFTGPECDEAEHWHANSGSAIATDGSVVPDTSDCGYGKTSQVPVITVPAGARGEVRGLEGLRTN